MNNRVFNRILRSMGFRSQAVRDPGAGNHTLQVEKTEDSLGWLAPGLIEESLQVSSDGKRLTYLAIEIKPKVVDGEMIGKADFTPTEKLKDDIRKEGKVILNREKAKEYGITDETPVYFEGVSTKKLFVVIDGKAEGVYNGISPKGPVFSPDDKRMGYGALLGNKKLVAVDGEESELYDHIGLNCPIFSPDSQRVAYLAVQGDNQFVVVDGIKGEDFLFVKDESIIFSHDSNRLVYSASTHSKEVLFVVEGVRGPVYEAVEAPTFSPFDNRFAYMAVKKGKTLIVLEGKEGKAYDGVTPPTFGKTTLDFGYVAERNDKQIVIVNGEESAEYEKVTLPVFSADGRVAYAAGQKGEMTLFIDGSAGEAHKKISNICFSEDGRRLFYIAEDKNGLFVVIDGIAGKGYDEITYSPSFFSPDGSCVAYGAKHKNKNILVVDNVESSEYWDEIMGVYFSVDGSELAYAAKRKGKMYVVRNNVVEGPYDAVDVPVFSPDGEHLVYRAYKGNYGIIVIDGNEVCAYEGLFVPAIPKFNNSKSFHTVAWKKDKLYRVGIIIGS